MLSMSWTTSSDISFCFSGLPPTRSGWHTAFWRSRCACTAGLNCNVPYATRAFGAGSLFCTAWRTFSRARSSASEASPSLGGAPSDDVMYGPVGLGVQVDEAVHRERSPAMAALKRAKARPRQTSKDSRSSAAAQPKDRPHPTPKTS